jgi:hypothetical protein
MSKTLLIIHHTPSPHCQELFEAVVAGATDPEIAGVEVVRRPALTVSATDMLEADGLLSSLLVDDLRGTAKRRLPDCKSVGVCLRRSNPAPAASIAAVQRQFSSRLTRSVRLACDPGQNWAGLVG